MYILRALFLFFFFIILVSCSKDKIQPSVIKEKSLELQVLEVYNPDDSRDLGNIKKIDVFLEKIEKYLINIKRLISFRNWVLPN